MNAILAIAGVVLRELYRRKDFYVLFVLTALITLLLGAVNFFNDDRIVRHLKEICLLLIWISSLVIALTTAARQIPAERENRTIYPLLAKPVSRQQLILGKFLGCWLACGLALALFYFFFGVISASREQVFMGASYAQALLLHWWMLGILVALTILGSVVFAAPSSNVTIIMVVTLAILTVGRQLYQVAMDFPEPSRTLLIIVYYAIPHLEFYDVRDLITHNWGAIPWWACVLAAAYAAVYILLFLWGAWFIFRRQSLSR
jgi:ABC-type transport system involved in multi-copper enzyme maturation permease subunit